MIQRVSSLIKALKRDKGSWLTAGLCILIAIVALWHAIDFSNDFDPEFPGMPRDHFSSYAPFAYRLAEPGDTLDLVVLYMSSAGLGLLLLLQLREDLKAQTRQGFAQRLSLLGICLLGFWVGAAPDPTMDGWHGLAWQSILRVSTPVATRIVLSLIAVLILSLICIPSLIHVREWYRTGSRIWRVLGVVGFLLVVWRVVGWPDPEPWGYWPRWGMIAAMIIALAAIVNQLPSVTTQVSGVSQGHRRRMAILCGVFVLAVVQSGYYLHWLHWPIPRFKVIIPGQLYVSAMPPPKGLALANERHQFETIINLFNEDTPQRHPNYPAEVAYAKSHGIKYVRAEGKSYGSAFVESTFAEARNPENWPVLVHCHGNMDRTPAWLGMYRFHFQGWSLSEVFAAIERHRGYRPKGGTSVLYTDVLSKIDPERWAKDPVARRLEVYTKGYSQPALPQASAIAGKKSDATLK
jgi:hypothetical protein